MNKKTLAIAAALLVATSGLASARTAKSHAQTRTQTEQSVQTFRGANNSYSNDGSQTFNHPGDNYMDGHYTK